ncbi:MAG: SUMF1/EgtB/PvdO family nonheme iron enzyme [Steroidobacteraceae bacterium]|nr:SUMF1/EgtB/PvdO family nonheme iron enzyme [Steroidobacteraceae bacterium]
MNDAALSKPGASYAQIRVREPAGERTLGASSTLGGEGADLVVPGAAAGTAVTFERREGVWHAVPAPGAHVRFDGRPLVQARELRRDDVLTVGEAQIVVVDDSRTRLWLDVQHLVGNATIAPVVTVAAVDVEASDEDVEIRVAPGGAAARPADAVLTAERRAAREAYARRPLPRKWVFAIAAGIAALLAITTLISLLESVELDVLPEDADISTPGTFLAFQSGGALHVLSGTHVVHAEREGYYPSQVTVVVDGKSKPRARLRLMKLPGKLDIDTKGVAATVIIDGVEAGKAPGEVEAAPGPRTVTLRAPRYLDFTANIDVKGGGERQDIEATLQPSWGTINITAVPAGARVSVDGIPHGTAPTSIQADSGVRRVQISAPGLKSWESSVVVKAGETLNIGPVTLGQPDAQVTVRSDPAGAEVTVGGTYRGRTPVKVNLSAGASHDIVAALPGYENWTKSVFAESGRKLTLDAKLEPILARVSVQGTPEDAELLVDGKPHGRTPQVFELSAREHTIEVRKEGFLPFTGSVTPAKGLERAVTYKLVSANRSLALQESAPTIKTKSGYVLRLVPSGKFLMGSDRREQGRRPNEGLREVTLERPYYIGVTEVTNAQFREFRRDHVSGYMGKRSFDLDDQPVVQVTWNDAAEYCNWLSEREGLPPAYERGGGKLVLKKPVTTGYRLPTEAEWEYAARYEAPGKTRRFPWGDTLPVAPGAGNLAGAETSGLLVTDLEGYEDEYPVVAPVGKFQPTPLGLHDMGGNVSEWVNDYYLSFFDSTPQTDPLGPEQAALHVVRGANWRSAAVAELRYAWRDSADDKSQTIGFRIARYAE